MDAPRIRPEEAAAALAQVRSRQEQVFTAEPFPVWYWPALGGLILLLTAATESGRPAFVIVGTVVFTIGLCATVFAMFHNQRFRLRNDLVGARGVLAIVAFAMALVAVGVGLAFGLKAAGVPWPGTIGSAVVALALVAFGPMLGRRLQRIMIDTAAQRLR